MPRSHGFVFFLMMTMTILAAAVSLVREYDTLVLEGGGVRGASFVGAMKAFESHGYYVDGAYKFKTVAGTSVGCVFGLAVALDISPVALERLVHETDFKSLFDPIVGQLLNYPTRDASETFGGIRYAYRWFRYLATAFRIWAERSALFGLSDDRRFVAWLSNELLSLSRHNVSTETTLAELRAITNHSLTCYATRIYDVGVVRMSVETAPRLTLRETLYSSAALPGIFQPIFDNRGFPLVDGSLLVNFPIYDYDDDNALGLSLNPALYDIEHLDAGGCAAAGHESLLGGLLSGILRFFHGSKTVRVDGRPIRMTDAVRSNVDFIKNIANVIVHEGEWLRYGADPANCGRVIYLNSTLHVLELDAPAERIERAISTAYANTDRFLVNRDAIVCNCLSYIEQKKGVV